MRWKLYQLTANILCLGCDQLPLWPLPTGHQMVSHSPTSGLTLAPAGEIFVKRRLDLVTTLCENPGWLPSTLGGSPNPDLGEYKWDRAPWTQCPYLPASLVMWSVSTSRLGDLRLGPLPVSSFPWTPCVLRGREKPRRAVQPTSDLTQLEMNLYCAQHWDLGFFFSNCSFT